MAIISVTRLRLRSLRFFPGFLWYTRRSIRQAKRTPGNLGVEQDTADWPSWETATEKLVATGRLVDVLHPSERQKAGVIETS